MTVLYRLDSDHIYTQMAEQRGKKPKVHFLLANVISLGMRQKKKQFKITK